MKNKLGSYLRRLRISHGEMLKDMAKKLDVTSQFLSAVENGKKKIPNNWVDKLTTIYELSNPDIEDLNQAIMESSEVIELNIGNVSDRNKELAISFARHFDTIDEETSKKLLEFLKKKYSKQED